jgi:hypothetical protein
MILGTPDKSAACAVEQAKKAANAIATVFIVGLARPDLYLEHPIVEPNMGVPQWQSCCCLLPLPYTIDAYCRFQILSCLDIRYACERGRPRTPSMAEEEHKALVVRPSTAVGRVSTGAESVLSRVVSDALILARSHSPASARFRVGSYEFREADYQQILLWAKALENTPEKIIEALEKTSFRVEDLDVISFQVKDGSISSLVWDINRLPVTEFVWIKDLKICEIAFIEGMRRWHRENRVSDRGRLVWRPKAISCHLPTLRRLACSDVCLRELDLSNVPCLTHLYCWGNYGPQLVGLNLSNVPNLSCLWYFDNGENKLTELDLSNVPKLAELRCGQNQLTKLDLSKVSELIELHCSNNQLTELDLSSMPELGKLDCYKNKLTEIDLSNVPELRVLSCGANQITELNLSNAPRLGTLSCHENQLTELDLSNVPELRVLSCSANQLTELDLSSVPELGILYGYKNKFTELDLSSVPELNECYCHTNQLSELDLSDVPKLRVLACSANQIIELDLSNVPELIKLYCFENQLTELDLSNLPALTQLDCFDNELIDLDLSNVPELIELDCSGNQITELDVRRNRKLKVFKCDPSVSIKKLPRQVFENR